MILAPPWLFALCADLRGGGHLNAGQLQDLRTAERGGMAAHDWERVRMTWIAWQLSMIQQAGRHFEVDSDFLGMALETPLDVYTAFSAADAWMDEVRSGQASFEDSKAYGVALAVHITARYLLWTLSEDPTPFPTSGCGAMLNAAEMVGLPPGCQHTNARQMGAVCLSLAIMEVGKAPPEGKP